jgi:NhaP-type Na+/H+ or K+/H+ antiporter
VTWGALVTLIGGAGFARLVLGWSWDLAFLFGALVIVTGPTVVGPLVNQLRLKPKVATVLEAEGVLIDPIGAIVAVLVLEIVLAPNVDSITAGAVDLIFRLGFGAAMGVAAGYALAWLLARRTWVPEGHENIFVLAAVLLLFNGCDAIITHSGILAVTVAGVVVGNRPSLADRDLREFKDQLTVLLIGLLFVMLAADVRFDDVVALGLGGMLVVGALVLVVRPLGVAIATAGSDYSVRERAFVAWIAPRGIVAAAIASVVGASLEREGTEGSVELRALVFLTIAGTVVLAGLTAAPIGRWLGVRLPGRDVIAILGANALGLVLGRALRDGGRSVVFIDSNPQSCRAAEEAGFNVVYGNAVQERTLQRARFETVTATVALTPNPTLNGVFGTRSRELFGVPRALLATLNPEEGLVAEAIERGTASLVFDGPHDVERWDVRSRRGDVEIEQRRYREPPRESDGETGGALASVGLGERAILIALLRNGEIEPFHSAIVPKKGDEVTVAIHTPEREEAYRALEARGYWELPQMVEGGAEGEAGSATERETQSDPTT